MSLRKKYCLISGPILKGILRTAGIAERVKHNGPHLDPAEYLDALTLLSWTAYAGHHRDGRSQGELSANAIALENRKTISRWRDARSEVEAENLENMPSGFELAWHRDH